MRAVLGRSTYDVEYFKAGDVAPSVLSGSVATWLFTAAIQTALFLCFCAGRPPAALERIDCIRATSIGGRWML